MINILHEILLSIINSIALDMNKRGAIIITTLLIIMLVLGLFFI